MRITVISAGYPPAPGGVADYSAAWIDAMRQRGHHVALITSTEGASGVDDVAVFRGPWRASSAPTLAGLIRQQRPEVLIVQYVPHAYSPRGGGLRFALLIRAVVRTTGVRLVVNAHEVYGAWDESARRVPWHLAQRVAAGVLIKTSTAFVVTVRKRQNDLGRLFRLWRNKIRLIPIGPTILPTAPDSEWRTRHEVDEATVIVSTLGLGHPTQDTAQFTQVLDHAVALGVNLHLFVGGRLTIAHPLATNLGFLDAVSAAQLLSASDLFALPLTDGISGRRSSAISALASGAVVVSTAGTDTDQDLFHDSGIMTTPAGDADAFSDAVIRLASDPERRAELGAQSQRFFREHFAWETIADRWDDLLTTSADVTKAKDA